MRYFEDVTRRHELEGSMRFGDAVARCEWIDGGWEVATASGFVDRFDWVVAATGILHHPKLPAIEGLDTFEGATCSTARAGITRFPSTAGGSG